MAARNHAVVNQRGFDNILEKIMGLSYKMPSVHRELASTGLSKLINTGHHKSMRVDIRGLFLHLRDEEAEELIQEAMEKEFSVECVMTIQKEDGCLILVDFKDITPVSTDEGRLHFLKTIQKLCFSMGGDKRVRSPELDNPNGGSNWTDVHSIFRVGSGALAYD